MEILDAILEKTYTSQDLRHKLRVLRSYLEFKLFGNSDEAKQFSPEDLTWVSSLETDLISKFNQENLYELFQQIEKEAGKLQQVIIYLAFEPTQTQIEQIHFWMIKNLPQKVTIDIKIDLTLLGGCALVYKGIYKDYSLRSRIQQQGETILTEFKKYVR